eukprot:TRINITY_DN4623_c1_g1_i1.p2 TRINITY_DN4623_c1_g1~~TRINITY_DN4623_c1_g1_i1.p2  ORF type:complete len:446 (+),score=116.40 TRINITY_DN4623_c1_g1_i1:298-1635(+)
MSMRGARGSSNGSPVLPLHMSDVDDRRKNKGGGKCTLFLGALGVCMLVGVGYMWQEEYGQRTVLEGEKTDLIQEMNLQRDRAQKANVELHELKAALKTHEERLEATEKRHAGESEKMRTAHTEEQGRLKAELTQLQEKLQAVEADHQALTRIQSDCKDQLASSQQNLDLTVAKLQDAQSQAQRAQNDLSAAQETHRSEHQQTRDQHELVRQELADVSKQHTAARAKVNELSAENDRLTTALGEARKLGENCADQQKKSEEKGKKLQTRVTELMKQLGEVHEGITASEKISKQQLEEGHSNTLKTQKDHKDAIEQTRKVQTEIISKLRDSIATPAPSDAEERNPEAPQAQHDAGLATDDTAAAGSAKAAHADADPHAADAKSSSADTVPVALNGLPEKHDTAHESAAHENSAASEANKPVQSLADSGTHVEEHKAATPAPDSHDGL